MTIHINGKPFDFMMVIRAVGDIEDDIEAARVATDLIDQARDQLLVELAAVRRARAVAAQSKLRATGMTVDEANRRLASAMNTSPTSVKRMVQEAGQYGVGTK